MSETILLVEDCEHDADLLKRAFRQAGLENPVKVVGTVDQAVAYLSGAEEFSDRQIHPAASVLLLDLRLPGKDGLDLLQWIRRQPELKRLLIVALSGYEDIKAVERAYQLGANTFLRKPFDNEQIKNLVSFFRGYWDLSNSGLSS
jgi:CheY-like chemotaxis protein